MKDFFIEQGSALSYTFAVDSEPVREKFFDISFWKDRKIVLPAVFGLLSNIILWILTISKFGFSHEKIALHFNVVYGVDFLGESRLIYQVAILGLMIFLINVVLAKLLYEREKLFSYLLVFASCIVQVILFLALVSLASLNSF